MSFIKDMGFRSKLLLLLVVPILGLLFFSLFVIHGKFNTAREMADVEQMLQMSVVISALVHEIQKERGTTAGFIASKGGKFSSQMNAQRVRTDEKKKNLDNFLSGFDQSMLSGNILSHALSSYQKIVSIRQRVSTLNIAAKGAISFYTSLNSEFLATINLVSKKSSNALIASLTTSYVNFLQGKERSGIERAVLSNIFASNKFSKGMLEKAISLNAMQSAFFSSFESSATPGQAQRFNALAKEASSKEVSRMRRVAYKAGTNPGLDDFGVDVDAAYWFKTSTIRINALKKLEGQLSENLSKTAHAIRQEADKSFIWLAAGTSVALIITLLLASSLL